MRHELELVEGSARKFWHIALEGSAHTVWYGRIGTNGQTQTKEFGSEAEAKKSYEKLLKSKLAKGYAEVAASAASAAASSEAAAEAPVASSASANAPPTVKADVRSPSPREELGEGLRSARQPSLSEGGEPSPRSAVVSQSAGSAADGGADTMRSTEIASTASAGEPRPPVADAPAEIRLSAGDWAWATWRPRQRASRGEPAPFDRAACVARLAKVKTSESGFRVHWEDAALPQAMTEEEALFWFQAMTIGVNRVHKPKDVAKQLASAAPMAREEATLDRVAAAFQKNSRAIGPWIFRPLAHLFDAETLLAFARDPSVHASSWDTPTQLVQGYREEVWPYLDDDALARVRASIVPSTSFVWTDFYKRPPFALYLAAMLGHPALASIVASIPDGHYGGDDWTDHYHQPQLLCFGLPSAELMASEMKRLRLRLKRPDHVHAWVAHTERSALDFVRDSIAALKNKDDASAVADALGAAVIAPETAAVMLELKYGSKATLSASTWLDAHPAHVIAGLVPLASRGGRIGTLAIEQLRELKAKGWGDAIAAAADGASRVIAEVVEWAPKSCPAMSARPAWLREALAATPAPKSAKPPAWLDPTLLPPLVVGDERLDDEASAAVLAAVRSGSLESPPPLLVALREHGDRAALDAWSWKIFDAWLTADAPSKERWALSAIGFVGGDAAALRLTPMVRAWPGESQHKRALHGLDVLRAIGSDTALMQIHGIAQKLKFKALKAAAREAMDAIAKARGMSREELEDRIVPDCDLDERGTRVFDFGPRQFRVVLGDELKPMVMDEQGKRRPDLPKPGAKDDAELASASVAAWKVLKKQLKEVVAIQGPRLELAMVTGRRWDPEAFELLLVKHPLMTNFATRLVWAGYDAGGARVRTFRVTEERDYADEHDEPVTLEGLSRVGIVHPYHLDDASAAAWGQVLADYEILQPFAQLGRPLHALEEGEASKTELTRFAGTKLPAASLVSKLERLGWLRGVPEDGGVFAQHFKPFFSANVTAIAQYDGVPVGYMVDWDDQSIDRVCVYAGAFTPETYDWKAKPVALSAVDPVVISEILRDLVEVTG